MTSFSTCLTDRIKRRTRFVCLTFECRCHGKSHAIDKFSYVHQHKCNCIWTTIQVTNYWLNRASETTLTSWSFKRDRDRLSPNNHATYVAIVHRARCERRAGLCLISESLPACMQADAGWIKHICQQRVLNIVESWGQPNCRTMSIVSIQLCLNLRQMIVRI